MRKILSIIALFAMFVSNAFGAKEYYALLVGIADYEQGGDLNGPDDDVDDIELMLVQAAGWDPDNIWVRKNSSASEYSITLALSDLSEILDSDDVFLFFYSGDADGEGDDKGLITYEWGRISPSDLNSSLQAFNTSKIVTIISAPYSGLFESISVGEQIMSVGSTQGTNPGLDPYDSFWCSHDVHTTLAYTTMWGLAGYADPSGTSIAAKEIYDLTTDPVYGPSTAVFDDNYYRDINLSHKYITTSGELSHSEMWSGPTIYLSGDVTVPSGKYLRILSPTTVNVNSHGLKCTGDGIIYKEGGATVTGYKHYAKQGSYYKGFYQSSTSIQQIINLVSSGWYIHVGSGTYSENITMKSGVVVDGAGKSSTTINGTVTFQDKTSAKLRDFTVNDRITVNSGSYNRIEDVQAKKRIVLNYGSTHYITNVTANHTDGVGIYTVDCDPLIFDFIFTNNYPIGILGLSGAYLNIGGGQLEHKSRGVSLSGYSDASLSSTDFCWNGWDIFASSGCYAMASYCAWSGDPEYKTYGYVEWVPANYYSCGMSKSVVAQQQPASAVNPASLENEDGWDKYIQALSDYNALKELLRSDTLSGTENVPEKYVSEYESIINLFKQIVTEYPGSLSSIKSLSRIADCYWNLGQPEVVFDYINAVMDNSIYDGLRLYAFKELVPYYLSKNDNDRALKVIDEVLALSMDDQLSGDVLFSKGIVYRYYEDDRTKAADVFQQVIALYPDSPLSLTAKVELEDMGVEYEAGDSTSTVAADGQLVIQTYPNPFNPVATIRFGLPEEGYVTLKVYDVLGREAATLVDGNMEAGWQMIVWNGKTADGREVPSGIYLARLVTPATARSIKLVLLR